MGRKETCAGLQSLFDEAKEFLSITDDSEMMAAGEKLLADAYQKAQELKIMAMFADPADQGPSFLEIHAGAGGTESQDWAQMLLRMYSRWAENKGFAVELLSQTDGEEAGIKSVTLRITGENAYGLLKGETGIHRLVRISPFDSNARRHTSFASVWAYPAIEQDIKIEIKESDCRIDTYRASGAGGQHVNKTDSAVRITHRPSGLVVQCQSERSQQQNREIAWKMLKAKMYKQELARQEQQRAEIEAAKSDIGWGHQIRSYVLQPYQMVKDLRTNTETSDTKGVLDGEIDIFIYANLQKNVMMS